MAKPLPTSETPPLAKPRQLLFITETVIDCACGSASVRCYGTKDQGDGSLMRYYRCEKCGDKFSAVITRIRPRRGNSTAEAGYGE